MTDLHQQGVPGVLVVLSNEDGQTWETETDDLGNYQIEGLAPGDYILKIDPPRGWRIVSPDTGFYSFIIRGGDDFVFDFMLKGVAIDFGKPPSTGGGGTNGKAGQYLDGRRHFSTMVRIRDIEQWEGEAAGKMVIEGTWSIEGEPNAAVWLVDAKPQGPYSLSKVCYENLDGNRFRLVLETSGWPGLAYNGDVMVLDLLASKGDAGAQLKVNTSRISFGNRGDHREVPGVSGTVER